MPQEPSTATPLPVIVGAPRSGTTLVRFMLDAHSQLAIPPETGFLTIARQLEQSGVGAEAFCDAITAFPPDAPAWQDFGIPAEALRGRVAALKPFTVSDGLRAFYALYAERFGKPRYGEKTPGYVRHIANIEAVLPEARFIHVIRDGRDVAASLRERWFSPGYEIEVQANFWLDHVRAGQQQGAAAGHYLELRYEDLIERPERELRRLCAFLELEFEPAMLRYYERTPERLAEHLERRGADGGLVVSQADRRAQQEATTRPPDRSQIGTWQQRMTPADAARFEAIAGDLLREYGYLPGSAPRRLRRLLRLGR